MGEVETTTSTSMSSVNADQCHKTISSNLTIKTSSVILASIDNNNKNSSSNSAHSSPCYSPLVSPPSSAFVSALQSPYISPRATIQPPLSSDDIPSSSYTPPTDTYEYSDDPKSNNINNYIPESIVIPRVSFSFPVPRISFAKASVSPSTANNAAKLRSCDVYIGFHGHNPNLPRFCKWMKSELEIQGMASFVADRAKYTDNQSHDIADRVICSVNYGIVVVTASSFLNHFSIEEMRFFAQKKNLLPVFFDIDPNEIVALCNNSNSVDKDCVTP